MTGAREVAVVGAGFTGLAAAYDLARAGQRVTVFERDDTVGGLAGTIDVGGTQLEKFYHHWFRTDRHVMGLAREVGLGDEIELRPTRTGNYYANRIFRLSKPLDLLRYTPLSLIGRIRLGLLALRAQRIDDWRRLEELTAREWLLDMCGAEVYEKVWEPLLAGKFGPYADDVAAVWMWNKLKLRGGSRSRDGREVLAYLNGGFARLLDRLVERIESEGGRVITGCRVERVESTGDGVIMETVGGTSTADAAIVTTALPIFADLIAGSAPTEYLGRLRQIDYLGNVCLILGLDRSLSHTYWLNVIDPGFPFVGIIEHTNFESPETYDGEHVVYLSKYLPVSDRLYGMSEDEMLDYSIPHIRRMFPEFDRSWIREYHLNRARYSQPVITPQYSRKIPAVETPLEGIYLSTMAQIYPEDRGTNYAVREGRALAQRVFADLDARSWV